MALILAVTLSPLVALAQTDAPPTVMGSPTPPAVSSTVLTEGVLLATATATQTPMPTLGVIETSWNGISPHAAFSARSSHTSLVFNNKLWIIGGQSYSAALSHYYIDDVWSSIDGKNWDQMVSNAPFGQRAGHTSVVFDDKIWVIGGYVDQHDRNDVWSSRDGINWTTVTLHAAFDARRGHVSVVFNNKMWVIGGYHAGECLSDVWCSSDGIKWSLIKESAEISPRAFHAGCVFNNKIWIIGGHNGSKRLNDVWCTSDGILWNQANANTPFEPRKELACFKYDEKI